MKQISSRQPHPQVTSRKVALLIGLAILLTLGIVGVYSLKKWSVTTVKPLAEPLPQDPFIQTYFNQSEAAVYTDPYRQQARLGDNLEQIIVDTILSAQSSIDVAVQELRLPNIAQALAEQHQAGIKVRVILEHQYSRPWSDFSAAEIQEFSEREQDQYAEFFQLVDLNQDGELSPSEIQQRDALAILETSQIPWIDDRADGSKGTGLMHHKFLIVDGQTVIVSSANFTLSGVHGDLQYPENRGNANHLLVLSSSQLATIFTTEFNLMWGDGSGGQPDSQFGLQKPVRRFEGLTLGDSQIGLQFSPISKTQPWDNSSNGLINQILMEANQSIDFALFVFSEQKLVNTLNQLSQRGVIIRGLIDPGFAFRYYSEALDMLGIALDNQCQYERDNLPWEEPIVTVGVPNLLTGDKLHHKFGIVDNQTVITGSHNWTNAANNTNDETVLVIQNPVVAAHFDREFQRLYRTASLGIPGWLEKKIATQLEACNGKIAAPTSVNLTGRKLNLNTATQAELEALPGIGPKLAQRIMMQRKQQPFSSLEDLDQVSGVGDKLLEQLQDKVTF